MDFIKVKLDLFLGLNQPNAS